MSQTPDLDPEKLRAAFANAGRGVDALIAGLSRIGAHLAGIGRAQAAMGWAYRGDLEQARRVLTACPADVLRQVSASAAALSSLADEVLAASPDRATP